MGGGGRSSPGCSSGQLLSATIHYTALDKLGCFPAVRAGGVLPDRTKLLAQKQAGRLVCFTLTCRNPVPPGGGEFCPHQSWGITTLQIPPRGSTGWTGTWLDFGGLTDYYWQLIRCASPAGAVDKARGGRRIVSPTCTGKGLPSRWRGAASGGACCLCAQCHRPHYVISCPRAVDNPVGRRELPKQHRPIISTEIWVTVSPSQRDAALIKQG